VQGNNPPPKANPQKVKHSFFKQLVILTQRYLNLVLEDKVNLILSLITAPIGIILINLAIRDQEPLTIPEELEAGLAPLALRVLFVFTSAALWVGLSTSLQEIVKESAIYLRERLVNLGLFSYLGSKLLVLGGLGSFSKYFYDHCYFTLFCFP
jgi:ABC transport system ATP-binding/permease protein